MDKLRGELEAVGLEKARQTDLKSAAEASLVGCCCMP